MKDTGNAEEKKEVWDNKIGKFDQRGVTAP